MRAKGGLCIILLAFLLAFMPAAGQDSVATHAALVRYKSDTLAYLYAPLGSYLPAERVAIVESRIRALMDDPGFNPDSLYTSARERSTDIMYKDQVVLTITPDDAKPQKLTQKAAAQVVLKGLKVKLNAARKSHNLFDLLLHIGLALLELLVLYLLIRYVNKGFGFTKRWLIKTRERILSGIRFRGYELLDTNRELRVALFINNILRWAIIILVFYLAIPILFSIFPWSRGLADKLFGYVLSPVRKILTSVINYIPNLFTIAVIYGATHYAVRFIRFLSKEIERSALKIPGFYPDWAMPTFNIVKVLIYAFMFIVIFPYLPGSDSPVFQGVSVFLGILFSFGSSSAISNIVAGLVITYMRPFRVGDRIKIGEITGDVIDKTLLVTRLRTIKNEDITIPNSSVLSGHTVNYTTAAREVGLIIYTSVTIGYDTPWTQVHELLIRAAASTKGILQEDHKNPFVLQSSLDDFYVTYQINAYTDDPSKMSTLYSELHQHIQDEFRAAGVEILSPHYRAQRDGNKSTVPPA